jgi:hypothetical protein
MTAFLLLRRRWLGRYGGQTLRPDEFRDRRRWYDDVPEVGGDW